MVISLFLCFGCKGIKKIESFHTIAFNPKYRIIILTFFPAYNLNIHVKVTMLLGSHHGSDILP